MDLFEKDMERIIAGKKAELLANLEEAKHRILHELYCVKEGIHTDACGLLADYNRIKAQLAELVTMHDNSLRLAVEKYQKMILEIMGAYENKFEGLDEIIQDIDDKVAEFDALREQLEALIGQLDGYAKEADLDQLRAELSAMIDQLRAELPDAQVQADWSEGDETSKAFIKNKPFALLGSESKLIAGFSIVGNGYGVPMASNNMAHNANAYEHDLITIEVTQVSTGEILHTFTGKLKMTHDKRESPTAIKGKDIYIWYSFDDGEKFTIEIYHCPAIGKVYCSVTAASELGHITGSAHYTATHYERPDPWLLGDGATVDKYLRLNSEGQLEWTPDIIVRGVSGGLYTLTVSDDGVLSAVPVTN